jgi:hypothetical protein
MSRSSVAVVGIALVSSACASAPFPTAPDRPLFRLETTGVADGAAPDPRPGGLSAPATTASPAVTAPAADKRIAYTTSIRLVRPDGTTLTAPRLTAFAGQHANIVLVRQTAFIQDFDVEAQDDAYIVDPVIGMLNEGTVLDLVVVPAIGRAGEAAVGLRLRSVAARKPIPTRTFEIAGAPGSEPVTIQTPRIEEVEVSGAQRLALGRETEWARVPDPAGGEDLRVLGRVDVADVAALDAQQDVHAETPDLSPFVDGRVQRAPTAPTPAEEVALRRLATAAAAAASSGTLRVTAVRVPAGAHDADAATAAPLGTLSVRTVAGEGARVADTLREAYLADWNARDWNSRSDVGPWDPMVDAAVSGLEAVVGPGATLRLRWASVARFDSFVSPQQEGPALAIDIPWKAAATRDVPLAPGRSVHPMFRLPDGGTAAVVVEFTPDQPR